MDNTTITELDIDDMIFGFSDGGESERQLSVRQVNISCADVGNRFVHETARIGSPFLICRFFRYLPLYMTKKIGYNTLNYADQEMRDYYEYCL